jgi:hypothetical protein
MIDVRALIGDIPTTSITLRTFGAPTINAFGESTSTSADTTITAVVHPADRRARERLPDADRARELIAVYVLDVDAFDAVRSTPAPWIVYETRTYEVVDVQDYVTMGGVLIATAALRDEVAP